MELGFATIYGLGDTSGRLAPTLRVAYGSAGGLAGRLTILGPTATDQIALLELAYGFDRSFRTIVPALSLGAGAAHASFVTGGPFRTHAWNAVAGGSAGVAAHVTDKAAVLCDLHALLAEPTSGAIVGGAHAAGKAELLVFGALGMVVSF